MKACVVGAITAGFLLLVLSSIWASLFPATSSWTDEKAARWSEIQDRLHNLGFVVDNPTGRVSMHSGPDPAEAKQQYDRLTIEHDQLTAEFQSAYDRPIIVSTILKWTGISLAVIGIIGWYAVKHTS